MMYLRIFLLSVFFVFVGCATSTEEGEVGVKRKQFFVLPSEQIEKMSGEAYEQTKQDAQKQGTLDRNPAQVQRVQNVARKLIPSTAVFRKDATKWSWEVHVITSQELNAYCMPGGKIVFYTGIIEKLNLSDSEMAAIMGHEIAHALREHGRERMSEEIIKQVGLEVLVASGKLDPKYAVALSVLSAVAISLPHGREQETEADELGLELMARAGFDPHGALSLWKKMGEQSGGKPPEILSTHPPDHKRLANLERLLPSVLPLFQQSKR